MGCPLCRKFAVALYSQKPVFDAPGVRLVLISAQEIGAEAFSLVSSSPMKAAPTAELGVSSDKSTDGHA